ncbi:MAG: tRNA pseudouridine(38-40) synthase TruA [Cyanobacteria bacterium REEB446]|nr:tRNA pseudouridine(38-40) synthase TruA [Cyanobacteria bacterium REEB446]
MSNFKLILEYNGEAFSGSQIQNVKQSSAEIEDCEQSPRTVQGELEKALSIYFRSNISTDFSSRTDAGVHAIGQVVNFHLNQDDESGISEPSHNSFSELVLCNPDKILIGLNGILPDDMVIAKIEPVADDFDARFSATAREYMYKIFIRKHRPVLRLDSLIWVKESLDFNAMQDHAQKFLGEHDFSAYYRAETYAKNPVCNVTKSEMLQESGICFKYYIRSNRFLKNMVRRIVGELIQVGKLAAKGEDVSQLEPNFSVKNSNLVTADDNDAISKSTDLSLIKPKAEAPGGLTLMKVFY